MDSSQTESIPELLLLKHGAEAVLVFSSVLLIGALPSHAEGPGDVLQGIGRAMNGEPPPPPSDYYWREHQRERAYWHEQHRLDAEQRELELLFLLLFYSHSL
jgi:hypothetical protein